MWKRGEKIEKVRIIEDTLTVVDTVFITAVRKKSMYQEEDKLVRRNTEKTKAVTQKVIVSVGEVKIGRMIKENNIEIILKVNEKQAGTEKETGLQVKMQVIETGIETQVRTEVEERPERKAEKGAKTGTAAGAVVNLGRIISTHGKDLKAVAGEMINIGIVEAIAGTKRKEDRKEEKKDVPKDQIDIIVENWKRELRSLVCCQILPNYVRDIHA